MKLNEVAPLPINLHVVYQSNYNGVDLSVNGKQMSYGDNPTIDHVSDKMTDWASEHCDEDGYFEGAFDLLKTAFTAIAREPFGADCTVTVEEDNVSS